MNKSQTNKDYKPISTNEPLLPYYVYILLNPLKSNRPFYIGKGSGQRVGTHNRDVDRLLRSQELLKDMKDNNTSFTHNSNTDSSPINHKQNEIIEIKNSGLQPVEVIVGRYETEQEAFAVEATLIHFVFGYKNLTNIASGHGSRFIREKDEFDEILSSTKTQEQIKIRPGIDIPREKFIRNNTYRNAKIKGLEEVGAYDTLAELKNTLTDQGFSWRDFTEPSDRRFHPGESNGFLAVIVRIGQIDFNIQFTKSLKFSLQFLYTQNPQKNPILREQLQLLSDRLNLQLGPPKAHNKYSWLNQSERHTSISSIIQLLTKIKVLIDTQP